MNTFKLIVSSPDGNKFSGEAVKLYLRGTEGEFAIMAGHIPFVTSLVKGNCIIWTDEDTKKTAVIDGGLLTVNKENATLLSGSFKFIEE